MATLVSPGVSVTLSNESFYATAGGGTVPLVVIATAQNKFQPGSTTALASGTVKSNSNQLYLVTSQRDALQNFGVPNFYSVAGTPQYDNELNELGLFALYEYLGIANSAYVLRADIDMAQLVPTTTEPKGAPTNGDYWLDLNNSTFGLFKSNGNPNSAFAWHAAAPTIINNAEHLENVVQGNPVEVITDASGPAVSPGGNLVINGIIVTIPENASITDVSILINKTPAITKLGIKASIFTRSEKYYPTGEAAANYKTHGDVYRLRLTSANTSVMINLNDSAPGVLTDLGLTDSPMNVVAPKQSFGLDGDFAIDTVTVDESTGSQMNVMWQKIEQITSSSTTGWWFMVGSTDATMGGWGWREASPRVITGNVSNPTFTLNNTINNVSYSSNVVVEINGGPNIDVALTNSNLDGFISDLNDAFNANQVNVVATKHTVRNSSYLQITNYDGTDVWLHDNEYNFGDTVGVPTFKDAGISTAQTFFGSIVGTQLIVSNVEIDGGNVFVENSMININLGTTNGVDVTVTSLPTTLDNLISDINAGFSSYVAAGTPVASKVVNNNLEYLKITNPNGTNFTLKDVNGTTLFDAGIPVGYTFGKKVTFKGYSPSLTVPNAADELSADSIWINTSYQNRGASFVLKEYANGTWVKMNTSPNTSEVPLYRDTASADAAFGAAKDYGTVFVQYNAEGTSPAVANFAVRTWDGSSWGYLEYTPSYSAPLGAPAEGTLWYNTDFQVDIMVSNGQDWLGYLNVYPNTDPNGPILDASAPLTQSDKSPLVDYDIWIQTSDIENYPRIYRYEVYSRSWVLVDNTDHSSSAGIIFTDARATADGLKNGLTTQAAMASSDYVDPDAPNAELYPDGLLLFNTRYSTNNVKVWTKNAVPTADYKDRWVTASGNRPDGTPYMGHWAQRNMVVEALKSVIVSNQDVRAEQTFFNLIATPGYTETISEMVGLNTDKKEIAFIIGDTPARLTPDATSIQRWATNANNVAMDGPDGLITHNDYAGIYYPWALSTNLDGNSILVPPSMMALRTYAYNDQVAYPWFAPAGFNRGQVTDVSSVGYLTYQNTYQPVQLSQGQRDVLYTNSINPIAYIPNRGLVVYGQKTLSPTASAMDRVNVARLINYLKYELDNLGKPFLFEPNDVQTRQAVTTTFTGFMGNLVGLRALYDFAVVCDESNNTSTRIDRNELWIDIAIRPEKAIEFIYIPIRLLNTADPLPGANRA